jgi:hypothetical protein
MVHPVMSVVTECGGNEDENNLVKIHCIVDCFNVSKRIRKLIRINTTIHVIYYSEISIQNTMSEFAYSDSLRFSG